MNCTRLLLFVTFLLAGLAASAQTTHRVVKGMVRDSTGLLLPGASVRLVIAHDTLSTITHDDGSFDIPHVTGSRFSMLVYMMSYAGFKQDYSFPEKDSVVLVGTIILQPNVHQLKAVTVKGAAMAVSFHGDTVEYSTAAYPVRAGSSVGEVVKRLPGVDVDHSGKVTAQGKEITRIRVNGKDFFGTDVNKALKNLPADIIDKLQVIDDYGDAANLSGVKTGVPQKIINLTLKPDKQNGAFGNATLAGGTSGRYLGAMNVNRFKGERQLSVVGDFNNTNAAAFSFGDNGGISGSDGSTLSHSAGINYRDQFSKKLMGYGSYSYSDSKSLVTGVTAQQTIDASYVNINNQNNSSAATNKSHNLNYNLEYKIDTLNFLKISPNLSWNNGDAGSVSQFHIEQNNLYPIKISDGTTNSVNTTKSPSVNGTILYNHRFLKKGRNLNITATYSRTDSKSLQDTRTLTHIGYVDSVDLDTSLHQQVNSNNGNNNVMARLSYTAPIDTFSLLEFNYSFNSASSNTLRETWNIDPAAVKTRVDSQSNRYNYLFITQRLSLNYNLKLKKHNITVGLTGQPLVLSGTSTHPDFSTRKTAFNFIPTARYTYNFNNSEAFSMNYNGSSSQPGFMQLMPVTDLSNPQYPVVGNPNLKPEFTQSVGLQYRRFDMKKGNTFFININGSTTGNRIVNNIINDSAHLSQMSNTVIQETRYLNTNGAYMANGYYSYAQPFFNRKFTTTLTGGVSYNNNISYTNDLRQLGRNWVWSQGARLRVNLPDLIEAELSGTYVNNRTLYSTPGGYNSTTHSIVLELYGKNYIGKHFIVGYNGSKSINSGYSSGVGVNPLVVNLYLECQLLNGNKAAIRLQGFDLFNENTGVYHTVIGPVITDTRNNRLSRYFLLSFSYRLQQFGF
ncbi:Outer membrane receptor proteins, mostly Fe transport [Chitinophaga costaii]|uniref:Outer membrane receptor proteins, mostly Fe transport n=1 Tax=Chitinophaga costaii TaxID=1335309 RepID=A0A1C4CQQ1_9BACT|nr:TonB-dependent receptor [Chitinophaga costaii]PUZ26993.1 hypothetical protein DCM91_07070 [Chitinophaga costaii]SCC21402.1 Outer membrane receptor proteins, mostly Fe transport [Chitinophaga costaii]